MPYREFPANPEPEPTELGGRQVILFVRIPAREGELPNLGLAIGREGNRPDDRAYVVCDAAFRSGKWTAYSGMYDLDWDGAKAELARRIRVSM
jgi:hypothetical protein